jgi:hypothetical protein
MFLGGDFVEYLFNICRRQWRYITLRYKRAVNPKDRRTRHLQMQVRGTLFHHSPKNVTYFLQFLPPYICCLQYPLSRAAASMPQVILSIQKISGCGNYVRLIKRLSHNGAGSVFQGPFHNLTARIASHDNYRLVRFHSSYLAQ